MRQGKTITDIIENVRARAKTAKYESATPHLVSERARGRGIDGMKQVRMKPLVWAIRWALAFPK